MLASIFPVSGQHVPVNNRPFFPVCMILGLHTLLTIEAREISSSYPLQVLLYFNLYYSIVWVAGEIAILNWKVRVKQLTVAY